METVRLVPAGWTHNDRQVYQTEDGTVRVMAHTYRANGPRNRRVTRLSWQAFETKPPYNELASASTLKEVTRRLTKILATGE